MFIAYLTGMSFRFGSMGFLLIILFLLPVISNAETHVLKLRASNHSEFLRIVLEGPEAVVSHGMIDQKGEDILVSFPGDSFTIEAEKKATTYKADNDQILLSPGNFGKFKFFFLKNPSRLIIDVFSVSHPASSSKKARAKENAEDISSSHDSQIQEINAAEEKTDTLQKDMKNNSNKSNETSGIKSQISDFKLKNMELNPKSEMDNPELKQAPRMPKEAFAGPESVAASHLALADKYYKAKDYLSAITHVRLAALYTNNDEQKELLLLKKAELYLKLGFYNEAKENYLIFLKNFSSSRYTANAHLGLAKSMEKIGLFNEAIEHYEEAGKNSEALFGKANALQKLGKIQEAHTAYIEAELIDSSYPERSPETYYLIGENLRMAGEKEEARQHLTKLKNSLFTDNASISLGLIALEESNAEEAIKYFKSASDTKDRNLKVQALLNLSKALLQTGKSNDAITTLEGIREKYPYTSLYKEAVLELSKMYKKEGRFHESVSLLKELVYSQNPPVETFNELEIILRETADKDSAQFIRLWNDFGKWMLDSSREQFLLSMAEALKDQGKPFFDLSLWLANNGSEDARTEAAIALAGFYAEMEEADTARKYLSMMKNIKKHKDKAARIEAKIDYVNGDIESAAGKIMSIKEVNKSDVELLWNLLSHSKISESKLMQKAVAFYKKQIELKGDSEDYIRLADILYNITEIDEALTYYKIAHENGIQDDWAMYRIGVNSDRTEAEQIFGQLQKSDSTLGHMAKAKQREMDIQNKLEEVF